MDVENDSCDLVCSPDSILDPSLFTMSRDSEDAEKSIMAYFLTLYL